MAASLSPGERIDTAMKPLKPREPVNVLLVDDQPGRLLTYRAILEPLGDNLVDAVIESAEECPGECIYIEP